MANIETSWEVTKWVSVESLTDEVWNEVENRVHKILTPEQTEGIEVILPTYSDRWWVWIWETFIQRDDSISWTHRNGFMNLTIGDWQKIFLFLNISAKIEEKYNEIYIHISADDMPKFEELMTLYFYRDSIQGVLPSLISKVSIYETEGHLSVLRFGF